MTLTVFVLLTHLAGAQCCGSPPVTFTTEAACRLAGEMWLAGLRVQSANDWFECVPRRVR